MSKGTLYGVGVGPGDPELLTAKAIRVLLGGGSDREQMLVCSKLREIRQDFKEYVEQDGVVIAICGGYQLLGNYYDTDQGKIEGLELADMYTEQGEGRLISNIVLQSDLFDMPIVGFENHGGRTYINNNKPLGKVLYGSGNDGKSGYEGIVYKNVDEERDVLWSFVARCHPGKFHAAN